MGTLLGHALPGSFFLLFAIWRLLQISFRLRLVVRLIARSSDLRSVEYFSSASFPCCFQSCARFPIEGVVKILVTSIGMGGELFASTDYGHAGKIKFMGDIQHVTMYGLFCLSGIVDVLCWKRVKFCPPGIDFLALANAFVCEWILFSHHLHGRTSIDVTLHALLLYVIAATALSIIAEYRFNKSLMASLATTYLLLLQGTWFIQVGVILYAPIDWASWLLYELSDSDQSVMATNIFAWHMAGNFIVGLLLLGLFSFLMQFIANGQRIERLWEAQVMSSSIIIPVTSVMTSASSIEVSSDLDDQADKLNRSSEEDSV